MLLTDLNMGPKKHTANTKDFRASGLGQVNPKSLKVFSTGAF